MIYKLSIYKLSTPAATIAVTRVLVGQALLDQLYCTKATQTG